MKILISLERALEHGSANIPVPETNEQQRYNIRCTFALSNLKEWV